MDDVRADQDNVVQVDRFSRGQNVLAQLFRFFIHFATKENIII